MLVETLLAAGVDLDQGAVTLAFAVLGLVALLRLLAFLALALLVARLTPGVTVARLLGELDDLDAAAVEHLPVDVDGAFQPFGGHVLVEEPVLVERPDLARDQKRVDDVVHRDVHDLVMIRQLDPVVVEHVAATPEHQHQPRVVEHAVEDFVGAHEDPIPYGIVFAEGRDRVEKQIDAVGRGDRHLVGEVGDVPRRARVHQRVEQVGAVRCLDQHRRPALLPQALLSAIKFNHSRACPRQAFEGFVEFGNGD